MSYIFFEDVLEELGHKLTYDAVVNYAGNSFCEKSWDMIKENNPFNTDEAGNKNNGLAGIAALVGKADIKIDRNYSKNKGYKGYGKGKV